MLIKSGRPVVIIWYFLVSVAIGQRTLLLSGGSLRDDNAIIWGKIIELAGGEGVARIGVLTAASETPEESFEYFRDIFTYYGAGQVYWIPVHEGNTEANYDPDVVDRISEMTGFFFGGGHQSRIINSFFNASREDTPALAAIRSRYQSGAVVAGTSAGAAVINTAVMMTGGVSYQALLRGSYSLGEESGPDDLTYDPDGGIGFLDGAVIEVHSSERGREGRLIRLLSDTRDSVRGSTLGIGLDENTALIITDDAVGEVIGDKGAIYMDIRQAIVDDASENWGIVGVVSHFLSEGDAIDMNTHEITYAGWKTPLEGQENRIKANISGDIFGGNHDNPMLVPEFTAVATSLFDAEQSVVTWGDTVEDQPAFRVWFVKDSSSSGYGGLNPRTGFYDISYHHLRVQIEEFYGC